MTSYRLLSVVQFLFKFIVQLIKKIMSGQMKQYSEHLKAKSMADLHNQINDLLEGEAHEVIAMHVYHPDDFRIEAIIIFKAF